MKKLIYEDINLKTKVSYQIYKYGYRLSEMTYMVYEIDTNGNTTFIGEFSESDAYSLVRKKANEV